MLSVDEVSDLTALAGATLQRGRDELRVRLAECDGRPHISVTVWLPNKCGQLAPVKGMGRSVPLNEIETLGSVCLDLAKRLFGEESRPTPAADRPTYIPGRQRPTKRDLATETLPPPIADTAERFDEFASRN